MTEKEKMLNTLPYNSRDSELLELYHVAREKMFSFNQESSRNLDGKKRVLKNLLGHCGEGVWIESPFFVDYGKFISIGEGSFVNVGCMFLDNNYITIGANALIGPGVHIYTAEHPKSGEERIVKQESGTAGYLTSSRPVTVGDNVWLGGGSIILPGIIIGDNVIVGAGSVVNIDIPSNCTAVGNPIRIIAS